MINELLNQTDDQSEELHSCEMVERGRVKYKAVYDALDDVKDPYALLILADGGLHCLENSDELGLDKLKRIFSNFAVYVNKAICEEEGEDVATADLLRAVAVAIES